MRYPVEFEREDKGGLTVRVPDIPGTHSFGEDEADALRHAGDAIETMLGALMSDGQDIPPPSPAKGRTLVAISALAAAKVALYQAMRADKVGKAELARRLGWHLPQVDRVLDIFHNSRLDHVEAALAAVGRRLEIRAPRAA